MEDRVKIKVRGYGSIFIYLDYGNPNENIENNDKFIIWVTVDNEIATDTLYN